MNAREGFEWGGEARSIGGANGVWDGRVKLGAVLAHLPLSREPSVPRSPSLSLKIKQKKSVADKWHRSVNSEGNKSLALIALKSRALVLFLPYFFFVSALSSRKKKKEGSSISLFPSWRLKMMTKRDARVYRVAFYYTLPLLRDYKATLAIYIHELRRMSLILSSLARARGSVQTNVIPVATASTQTLSIVGA